MTYGPCRCDIISLLTVHILWRHNHQGNPKPQLILHLPQCLHQRLHLLQTQEETMRSTYIFAFAIPDRHLLSFHDAVDARSLWKAIKARFGGNEASKKMQKNLSLPSVWHVVATMIRGQPGLDELDFDDLYNNLKVGGGYDNCKDNEVYEEDRKGPNDLKPKNGECLVLTKYQENKSKWSSGMKMWRLKIPLKKALVATDNNEDIDWTKEFDAEPVTYAMMALTGVEQDDWSMEFDAEHVHFGQDGLMILTGAIKAVDTQYFSFNGSKSVVNLTFFPNCQISNELRVIRGNPGSEDLKGLCLSVDSGMLWNSMTGRQGQALDLKNIIPCLVEFFVWFAKATVDELSYRPEDWGLSQLQKYQQGEQAQASARKIEERTGSQDKVQDLLHVNFLENQETQKESLAKAHNDDQRIAFEEEKKRIALDKGKECVDSTFTLSTANTPPQKEPKKSLSSITDESGLKAMQESNCFNSRLTRGTQSKPSSHKGTDKKKAVDYDEVFVPVARIEASDSFLRHLHLSGLHCLSDGCSRVLFLIWQHSQQSVCQNSLQVLKILLIQQGLQSCQALCGHGIKPKEHDDQLQEDVNILEEDWSLAIAETKPNCGLSPYMKRRDRNPVFHSKTKHIQIRHHFIRDCYEQRLINVVKVHTDDNVAELQPKALTCKIFLFGGPYTPSIVTILVVPAINDSTEVPKRTAVETILNMSPENKAYCESEKEAIHLLLTRIGDKIYSIVDACKTAHEMWIAIKRLQQGESLNIQNVKTNLFWEFRKFTSHNGESMESYYSRFYKMMNEMIRNNLTVTTMQINVQFLQQLQPKWSRFVTIVKQQHDLDTVSYHKLFDVLKQYQKEVNEIHAERITKNANH
ncbi:hypothetical protein Tco_0360852 [Tanacetum coccineum]